MDDTKENFIHVLKDAGWHQGRNIKSKIEDNPLYKLFPKNVQNFFCEFGGLTLHVENKFEIMAIYINHFSNPKAFEYYDSNTYRINDEIDLGKDDLTYYYSTLIGLQLYPVAGLIEHNTVLMDENGNFYIIDFIPQLIWISNNTFDALVKIVLGSSDISILNEHTLTWMAPVGKELNHILPLNPLFRENNPWG
jgi:hypothetical protein